MTLRPLAAATLGVLLCTSAAAAPTYTYNRLNQISGAIVSAPTTSVNQNFEASFGSFDGAVVDDASGGAGTLDRIAVALEFSTAQTLNDLSAAITGWDIFASSSIANLASGGGLLGSVSNGGNVTVSTIASNTSSRLFEITGLNFAVAGGSMWYGVRPVINFNPHGQIFMTSGGSGDAVFINPGNGFGLGTSEQQAYGAALGVNITQAVPEPASLALVATALGLLAVAARRRRGA